MQFYHFISSLFSGLSLGLLYGLFFLRSKKRAFNLASTSIKTTIIASLTSALSIVLITTIFFYLLRLTSIQLIILLPAFIMAFWLVILNKGI